ncbi:GntR family transcriptional regulator [Oceanicola sp. 22II-s10i]|uniref:GntR family transcriptional regulator n=1 Tax=Oceanicola sp. 22II-s10i TaxID=1317116 RepID=UPI0015958E43|nr:GntR family transcriptional regulator [Oceanicola sp. 22II-s10i]
MAARKGNATGLAQHAYEAVRDAIEHGKLAPGDRISEYKTADWLNISRTPAREGLLRLESEGLLTHHPRRGLVVASVDAEALKEVFAAREVMERALAGLAARNASGPELDAIVAASDQEPELIHDRNAMIEVNKTFHGAIRQGAHNRYLTKFISTLDDIVAADHRGSSLVDMERRQAVIGEHRALAEAIANRDVALAEQRASDHIRNAYEARKRVKEREKRGE